MAKPSQATARFSAPHDLPSTATPQPRRVDAVRRHLQDQGLSACAIDVLERSIRPSTAKTYEAAWSRWLVWCRQHRISATHPSSANIIDFLASLTAQASSYSAINTARSALTTAFPGLNINQRLVNRVLRAASLLHPPAPRYASTFDITTVYRFIEQHWRDHLVISFRDLSCKTAFLLSARAILRSSDLARISASTIRFSANSVSFVVKQPKESSVKEPHRPVVLHCTQPSVSCGVCTLRAYMTRTFGWRSVFGDDDHLFMSVDDKFTPVSAQRIAKWITFVLQMAGIDTTIFKAHSVRSATATNLRRQGASVEDVMRHGHWRSRSVFSRFYDRA